MRVGTDLYYLLSDHLGSSSITTSANGTKLAETRYDPWGQVRYNSGNTPTDRTYTGQRSYTNDFGLMFYNARWYDPTVGRFAQADTIIPKGVQGLDRYAYVSNNPIMYIDPTGHMPYNCSSIPNLYPEAVKSCEAAQIAQGHTYSSLNVFYNLVKLGLVDPNNPNSDPKAAMEYVLATELGPGNIDNPDTNLPHLREAMGNRYYEFCSEGAWTVECLRSFWGYMQGVLHPDSSNASINYQTAKRDHSSSLSALADNVLSSNHGCGPTDVCAWATIISGSSQLFTCLLSNPNCWAQNPNVQQWSFGNVAYISWLHSGSAFIVLSIAEQENICTNPLWSLPRTCSLLEIP